MNQNCRVTDDVFCYSNNKESSASLQDNFCANVFAVHFVMTVEIAVVCYTLLGEIINSPFFWASFCALPNGVHCFPCSCKTLTLVIFVKTLSE
jgi:hypothetical protein